MTAILLSLMGLVLGQATSQASEGTDPVPPILTKAFMQRMSFKTARFTVRIEESRRLLQPYVRRFRFEWAGGKRHIVDLGDDHGMFFANQETAEVPLGVAYAAFPRSYFVNATNDDIWEYGMGRAVHCGPKMSNMYMAMFPDPRSYGLRGSDLHRFSPKEYLDLHRDHPESGRFIVEDMDKTVVHIRHIGDDGPRGHFEMEWWIDTSKGSSVIGMQDRFFPKGGQPQGFADMKSTVEQIDGIWWPRRIEYKRSNDDNDRTGVVTFDDIEFDRPTHPQTLDADAMKIPIGTKVAMPPEKGGKAEWARYVGCGKTISESEWAEKKADYDTQPLDAAEVRYALPHGKCPDWWDDKDDAYGLKDAARRPELWELYVRRWALKRRTNMSWVAKDPLTDEQCRAAQEILDECRKQAVSAEPEKVESRFGELKKRLNGLLTDAQRDPGNAGWRTPTPPPIPMRPRRQSWRPVW